MRTSSCVYMMWFGVSNLNPSLVDSNDRKKSTKKNLTSVENSKKSTKNFTSVENSKKQTKKYN